MICLTLYLEFFKIGILAFGGGLTSIPFLQDLSVKYS
ncbi:MAG: chromate transporter, partial [Oscillospiraceae bacterium]